METEVVSEARRTGRERNGKGPRRGGWFLQRHNSGAEKCEKPENKPANAEADTGKERARWK